jgi:hypothetical protein
MYRLRQLCGDVPGCGHNGLQEKKGKGGLI